MRSPNFSTAPTGPSGSRTFAPLGSRSSDSSNWWIFPLLVAVLVILLILRKWHSLQEKKRHAKATWDYIRNHCSERGLSAADTDALIAVLRTRRLVHPERVITSPALFENHLRRPLIEAEGEDFSSRLYRALFLKPVSTAEMRAVSAAQAGVSRAAKKQPPRAERLASPQVGGADLLPAQPPKERLKHKEADVDELLLADEAPGPEEKARLAAAAEAKLAAEDALAHEIDARLAEPPVYSEEDLRVHEKEYDPSGTSELLQAGQELQVRFDGQSEFCLCPILHVSWDAFTIALPEDLRDGQEPTSGAQADCHLQDQRALYNFHSEVLDVIGGGIHVCRLTHAGGVLRIERRKSVRLPLNLPFHFFHFSDEIFEQDAFKPSAKGLDKKVLRKGILQDLSIEGCALAPVGDTSSMQVGHFLRFQFTVAGDKRPLSIFGRILRFSLAEGTRNPIAHIQFVGQDESTRQRLIHLMCQLKRRLEQQDS